MSLIHSVLVGFSRFCAVSIGELAFLPPLDLSVLLSDPVAQSLEETFEVPMRVGSSSSLNGSSSVCLLPCPSLSVLTWGWSWLPLPGVTSSVWSSGRFWLLGAGSRPVGPLRSLAQSHSGVCAVRVGVAPPPLVSSLTAALFGYWPYGLAIAAFPLVSCPWTDLR